MGYAAHCGRSVNPVGAENARILTHFIGWLTLVFTGTPLIIVMPGSSPWARLGVTDPLPGVLAPIVSFLSKITDSAWLAIPLAAVMGSPPVNPVTCKPLTVTSRRALRSSAG